MKDRLNKDLKEAMKSKDENRTVKLTSIRAVKQAISTYENAKAGNEINDEVFTKLVDGLIKTREKTIVEYVNAERLDLANIEQMEIDFIKEYLPERVDNSEIKKVALELQKELGADSKQFMGPMISKLKQHFGTSAKPADISKIVQEILS